MFENDRFTYRNKVRSAQQELPTGLPPLNMDVYWRLFMKRDIRSIALGNELI
jgi:hypothetical protein